MFDVFGALFSPVLWVLLHAIRTGVGGAGVDVVTRGGFKAYPTGGMLAITGEMTKRWEMEGLTMFTIGNLRGGSPHSSWGSRGLPGGLVFLDKVGTVDLEGETMGATAAACSVKVTGDFEVGPLDPSWGRGFWGVAGG